MTGVDGPILTDQQLSDYKELGFLHSLPILSDTEVNYYRAELDRTREAIGGLVPRFNGLHLFFQWALHLSTHPRLLDRLEQLMGPNILLTSTRFLYKHGHTNSYVGWHQDGITQRLDDARAPAIWLGLTAATAENGCLRVVPRSHQHGMVPHDSAPDLPRLPEYEKSFENWPQNDLSGRIAQVPSHYDPPFDIVMRAGEMSIHHPLMLHGSNANLSPEPRIGLSASYTIPELCNNTQRVVWARRNGSPDHNQFRIDRRPNASFEEAVAAYCADVRQTIYARSE
jgi:non-haem Fe2+, alpha-ketoglutarate-dependent halogenase